jgi:hypothetical protein
MQSYIGIAIFIASLTVPAVSHAQSAPLPAQPTPPATPSSPPEIIAPKDSMTGDAHGGVLHPPNVDPGIDIKPPADPPQSMPVVPRPGSPGGNPKIVPK